VPGQAKRVVINRGATGLELRFDDKPAVAAGAISDGRFASAPGPEFTSVQFEMTEDGRVTGLAADGQDAGRYVKQPTPPPTSELERLVGTYWSEELETRYDVRLRDDQLVIEHRRHGSAPMARLGADRFLTAGWIYGQVRFVGTDGAVTGLLVSNFGVENLRFEKQSPPTKPR